MCHDRMYVCFLSPSDQIGLIFISNPWVPRLNYRQVITKQNFNTSF